MSEYIAAMKGVKAIHEQKANNEPNSSNLSNNDIDELKSFLKERT